MLNFPLPYPDELIYSVITRYAVHHGILDRRKVVADVFRDRAAAATVDLPNHLNALARHYEDSSVDYSAIDLAYAHTMFPLYAPFVPQNRRNTCLKWLSSSRKGAVHLALGIAAGRAHGVGMLRWCPSCVKKQFKNYGEPYWDRRWFVSGTMFCAKHQQPYVDGIRFSDLGKHEFVTITNAIEETCKSHLSCEYETQVVDKQATELLSLDCHRSPTHQQWSTYYTDLSENCGCRKGKHIDYEAIYARMTAKWSDNWLRKTGLAITNDESNWVKSIFRKHRKSFSFLEHIVAIDALQDTQWDIAHELDKVLRIKKSKPTTYKYQPRLKPDFSDEESAKKKHWEELVQKYGVKIARKSSKGGGLYAWLYRHHREWLLEINNRCKRLRKPVNNRVDWRRRDYQTTRKLIEYHRQCVKDTIGPRRSLSFYLNALENRATIEKNLHRLKFCRKFLNTYSESVAEYQIRRIKRVNEALIESGVAVTSWRLYRLAGLSPQTITKEAIQQTELLVNGSNGEYSKV